MTQMNLTNLLFVERKNAGTKECKMFDSIYIKSSNKEKLVCTIISHNNGKLLI